MSESYEPEFFASLFAIEDRHFWFRARNRVIGALVRDLTANLAPGYRVLEVGCGTGAVLATLEKTCDQGTVIGMDLFEEGLGFARQRTSCQLVQGDIHNPPFEEKFDIVGLFDVLEHLPDDRRVLNDLAHLLAPGGALMLTVPANPSLWSYFDEAGHHQRRYEEAELTQKLQESGYRIEFLTPYMAALFPLVWLGRRLAARRAGWSKDGDKNQVNKLTSDEFRIVPVLNEVLAQWLFLEARWVARRRHLPLGTSLLAIARREKDERNC